MPYNKLIRFQRPYVYARNDFFKLNQIYKRAKSANFND